MPRRYFAFSELRVREHKLRCERGFKAACSAAASVATAAAMPACCGFRPIRSRTAEPADYHVRSSGKRLLMIFRVGSACSDYPAKGSRPWPNFPCITVGGFLRVYRVSERNGDRVGEGSCRQASPPPLAPSLPPPAPLLRLLRQLWAHVSI